MHCLSPAFLALYDVASLARAQAPTQNTNPDCNEIGSDATSGFTYNYDSTDTDDFGSYLQVTGATCDPNSYGAVTLVTPSGGTVQCGDLPKDGNQHLISCPNYPRGSIPDGTYNLQIYIATEGGGPIHTTPLRVKFGPATLSTSPLR